jgi:nucleoside-triphosphatase
MDISDLPPISGNSNIVVVTGWRDVGKTTYCQRAIDVYRTAGLIVSGLLSPARFDQKRQKTGFFALDLHSRETRLVASAIPGEIEGVHLGPWSFDAQVFTWGNHCLQQVERADVLVIDELGPLEFNRQIGWLASFELLRSKDYHLALVVIRPECIDAFSALGFAFQTKEIAASQVA